MKALAILSLLLLVGCDPTITNDEIIAETKKCEDAGLRGVLYVSGFTHYPSRITCYPLKEALEND